MLSMEDCVGADQTNMTGIAGFGGAKKTKGDKMRTIGLVLAAAAVFLLGCSGVPQEQAQESQQTLGNYRATWKSVPELQDVMDAMVEVNAEALWNVAIEEQAPKTGEDWEKLDHAAITLIETGKFLKVSDLAKDNPDWPQDADRFIAQAQAARNAVKEKNLEQLLEAGNEINEACTGCHNKYFEDQ
jgi:cytochrome c556